MRTILSIFCLPLPLLLLIPSYSTPALGREAQWPEKLGPRGEPSEVELLVRRNAEIQNRLAEQRPCGVKKMPADEGEMFFLEYWLFDRETREGMDMSEVLVKRELERKALQEPKLSTNASIPQCPQPALLLHTDQVARQQPLLGRSFIPGLAWIYRRDFSCPDGTTSCSSIGQSNSCCQNGLTCNIIPDTGLGIVGCCPAGGSCAGQVASCPSGYSSCPSSEGGGCCIPGYDCSGVGCEYPLNILPFFDANINCSLGVLSSTTTVIVFATVTASIPSSTSVPVSITQSPSTSTTPPTPTSTSNVPSSTSTSTSPPPSTSSTITANAPLRPTSAPATTIPSTVTVCPTGFYQCSAYFNGGNCCQVGRDCALTSCPPHSTATAIASNGVTVVNAPTGASGGNSGCATGWSLCGAGQGCCPSGYSCSGQECLAGTAAAASGATASFPVQAVSSWAVSRALGWGLRGTSGLMGLWVLGLML